jgi:tetratricopeptide (TPR) repeat protein
MFRPRSIGLLLALVTLLVYLPATSDQFIDYDDQDYVTNNSVVQNGLTWTGVKWAFTGTHVSNWHPLTWLSHMADCDLFRLNPAGPHLVNILFHSVNTALLFALLFRLTKKLWPAAFVAALFAWHPLHVESVAWISERKDMLSTFFALLTLLSYAHYVQKRSKAESRESSASMASQALDPRHWTLDYYLAQFFFVLALLSKPMPVTLPLVMLLLDYWPLKRFEKYKLKVAGTGAGESSIFNFQFSAVLEKWPFFLLSAASCIITFLCQRDTAMSSLTGVPFSLRLENALTAYGSYLWKMVWPMDLAVMYPLHAHIAWQLIAESVIVLTGISLIAWRERKCSPWLIVGWLWFLVTLVPVIGLVQVGQQAMADRYSYFPLIGIFLVIAFSAQAAAARFAFLKKWCAPTAILILGACLLLTERQLRYWHDSESLFTHTLAIADSATAHINLGGGLMQKNRVKEAMSQYIMAWRLNPDADSACFAGIAIILHNEDKFKLAVIFYQKAAERKSPLPLVYEDYGIVLVKLGRFDEAMKQFFTAAQIDPNSAEPHFLMGKLLLQQGRDAEAMAHLHAALQLDPNNLEILLLTAGVQAADEDPQVRDGAEARSVAEKLVQLTGGQQPAALDALAMACAENGQFDEAVQIQQRAVKLIEATGPKEDIAAMQNRLELYQKRQPWRESFKKTSMPEKLNPP